MLDILTRTQYGSYGHGHNGSQYPRRYSIARYGQWSIHESDSYLGCTALEVDLASKARNQGQPAGQPGRNLIRRYCIKTRCFNALKERDSVSRCRCIFPSAGGRKGTCQGERRTRKYALRVRRALKHSRYPSSLNFT